MVDSFISLKNVFAFCNENSKNFPEKLYEQGDFVNIAICRENICDIA
jgi:hypothetical protein